MIFCPFKCWRYLLSAIVVLLPHHAILPTNLPCSYIMTTVGEEGREELSDSVACLCVLPFALYCVLPSAIAVCGGRGMAMLGELCLTYC